MQRQITVGTMYECKRLNRSDTSQLLYNPTWRHNMIGCFLLTIFQQMYNINVSFVIQPNIQFSDNNTVDLSIVPLTMNPKIMEVANPVQSVVLWRFGFVVEKPSHVKLFYNYYTKPFTNDVWDYLCAMDVVVTILFFIISWWEKRMTGSLEECSFGHEMLLVIGGYTQHIFPVETNFLSRRTAYFTFFLYAYLIYTVYTSNLLSHLVNDKDSGMKLQDLLNSDYNFVTFSSMKDVLTHEFANQNLTNRYEKLAHMEVMEIKDALSAVKANKTAFLTDYKTVYRYLKRNYCNDAYCEMVEIDLDSDVRKYIFASKTFAYTEELRICIMRAKEVGLVHRLESFNAYQPIKCITSPKYQVMIAHIFSPLVILMAGQVLAIIILLLEKIYYKRTRLWPYYE